MRSILFFICSFIFAVSLNAQNWQNVGGGVGSSSTPEVKKLYADTINSILYASGNFTSAGGVPVCYIAKWNDIIWDSMPKICPNGAIATTVYNNQLYVSSGNGTNGIVIKWNGTNWVTVGISSMMGATLGFYNYSNELYAFGIFDSINNIPASRIAKYNGTTWSAIDTTKWYGGFIMSAIVYQGELYIGGNMYNWNGTIGYIAKWNGIIWQTVGNSPQIITDPVESFEIYNNDLYVGVNTMGYKPSGIYKWDGTQWTIPGGGITGQNAAVYDMKIFNSELYACGRIEYAGGIPAEFIAKWDGTNWCSLGDTISSGIFALEVYNNELYIGGGFKTINGDTMNYISKWIGGNFVDSCGNTSGVNENNISNEINIYPNPSNGIFTIQSTEKISEIEITNILGEKMTPSVIPSGVRNLTIDLSNHPNGIYFLQVIPIDIGTENGIITRKIIKQ